MPGRKYEHGKESLKHRNWYTLRLLGIQVAQFGSLPSFDAGAERIAVIILVDMIFSVFTGNNIFTECFTVNRTVYVNHTWLELIDRASKMPEALGVT